ncbi:MAG TPA: hypothetical protein VD978_14330 [Azospirillum sp.]|nr:hypothetical protein [Azospirillum sp.]
MTAKAPILLLLAGLLASTAQAAAPIPARKPGQAAEPPKEQPKDAAKEPPRAADQSPTALLPDGEWRVGPVNALNGTFAYCVAENRYVSGHALVIARNTPGELNIAVGIPGAQLPKDQQWDVTMTVDDAPSRQRLAVAMQPDMLVIPQGKDDELFEKLQRGRQLAIVSASDRVAFQLKGTKKALGELKDCAEKGKPAEKPKPAPQAGKTPFPDALGEILAAAGLREAKPVSFDDMPEDKRVADYAWRIGRIFGGVRERTVGDDATLLDLTNAYVDALKARCSGKANATLGAVEVLQGVEIRTGAVDCQAEGEQLHVALTFYLTGSRLFTTFFHEGTGADAPVADKARDNITAVLRRLAGKQP